MKKCESSLKTEGMEKYKRWILTLVDRKCKIPLRNISALCLWEPHNFMEAHYVHCSLGELVIFLDVFSWFCLNISFVFICSSCYSWVKTECSILERPGSPGLLTFLGCGGVHWSWSALECPSLSPLPLLRPSPSLSSKRLPPAPRTEPQLPQLQLST